MTEFVHDKYTRKALQLVDEGLSFFITGKAGTGKTMLLRQIVSEQRARHRNVLVCAPTGIAAKHAGGSTLHSQFRLPISIYIPGHRMRDLFNQSSAEIEVIRKLDLLIIDEVSMVRCDLMDMLDSVLRYHRSSTKPFGGIQVVMFGDMKQLMPVAEDEDEEKLLKHYRSLYFFSSEVVSEMKLPMLELITVHRQNAVDFISLLNDVREGRLSYSDERRLRAKYNKKFNPGAYSNYIRLTTHKSAARKYNQEELDGIRKTEYTYTAWKEGFFPWQDYPTEKELKLKVGARVMFVANDNQGKQYVNGTLGVVTFLSDDCIQVKKDNGEVVDVKKSSWDFYRHRVNRERKEIERQVLGTFHQYPLKLAWAITIHKSQGQTFDRVVIDAGRAFAYGQVYVALSRCRTFDGIVFATPVTPEIVKIDPLVVEYTQLVPHIWPDPDVVAERGDESGDTRDFIKRLNYTPIGHVFQAAWDNQYYDAWESARQEYCLDRLMVENGKIRRLCVGLFPQGSTLFDILSDRDYNSIASLKFHGGTASEITVAANGKTETYNFRGSRWKGDIASKALNPEIRDRVPILRRYDFKRNGETLKIGKHSKLSDSSPSEVKTYSDLGKLLLCCNRCKILRNDSFHYDVAIEDGNYRVYQYDLKTGQALTDEGRIAADRWYQRDREKANIKASYTEVPATRKVNPVKTKERKPKPAETDPDINRKILACLKGRPYMKANDIADRIGIDRKLVNSRLYGELSRGGLVQKVYDKYWKLKH